MTLAAPVTEPNLLPQTPDLYDRLGGADRYIHLTRDRAFLALLRRHGFDNLCERRIIELACGEGALLRSLLHYGANRATVAAVDLSPKRSRRARASGADVGVADIAALPYRDGAFDLALAFTAFSSILDPAARRRAAKEALRVLRPGGLLVVYDFWTNPLNRRVRPVGEEELHEIVAPHAIEIQRITLAPPIVRALGGRPSFCAPLESLPWLRTHLLAAVRKERWA